MSEPISQEDSLSIALKSIDDIWPFKRIRAPKYLIDRYNESVAKGSGRQMVDFAITVDKNYPATEEDIWKAMTMVIDAKPYVFGDSNRPSNPPHTGMVKKSILDS